MDCYDSCGHQGLVKDVFTEHYRAPDGSQPSLEENSPAVGAQDSGQKG